MVTSKGLDPIKTVSSDLVQYSGLESCSSIRNEKQAVARFWLRSGAAHVQRSVQKRETRCGQIKPAKQTRVLHGSDHRQHACWAR